MTCVGVCVYVCMTLYVWRSEDNLWYSVSPFRHLSPGYGAQVAMFLGECPDLPSHLSDLLSSSLTRTKKNVLEQYPS